MPASARRRRGNDFCHGLLRECRDQYEKFIQEGKEGDFSKRIERVDAMIRLVEEARDGWLAEAVAVRDGISHYYAAKNLLFKPVMTEKGIDAERPVFTHKGKTFAPVPFLEGLYVRLVVFAQDFICRALHLRMRWPVELTPADQERAEAFSGKEQVQFIRWEWTMNGEPVRGMHNTGSSR